MLRMHLVHQRGQKWSKVGGKIQILAEDVGGRGAPRAATDGHRLGLVSRILISSEGSG